MNLKPQWPLVLCVAALLSACGGGSETAGTGAPPNSQQPAGNVTPADDATAGRLSFAGAAATGAGIVNAPITWKCVGGVNGATIEGSGTTTDAARYLVTMPAQAKLPCVVRVVGPKGPLHAAVDTSHANQDVNITPLTDLQITVATSMTAGSYFDTFNTKLAEKINVVSMGAAQKEVIDLLRPVVDISAMQNFVNDALLPAVAGKQAGNAADVLLDRVNAVIAAKGQTYPTMTAALLAQGDLAGAGTKSAQKLWLATGPEPIATPASAPIPVPARGLPTQAAQTITFASPGTQTIGSAATALSASASSGLPVTFRSGSSAVCKTSGTTLLLVSPGTCQITASQAGNASFAAAPVVVRSFIVNAAVVVTTTTETQTLACAAGQTGSITQTRTITTTNGVASNGAWSTTTNTCTTPPPPRSCVGQALNWTVGDNSCTAPVPTTASGVAAIATDSTAPTTGSASFSCTNGNWGAAAANATCTVTDTPTVTPVTQLLIAPETRTAIKLTWEAPSDAASYVIYRKAEAGAGSFVQVAAPAAAIRTYVDSGLVMGTRYTYRLVRKLAGVESAPAEATQSSYVPPIVITTGGTYSGNWDNTGTADRDAAVTINTGQPVIIQNSYIRSPRQGIDSRSWNTDLLVKNSYGIGVNPNIAGRRKGQFVNLEEFASVTLENNWIEGYQAGLRAMNYDPDTKANRSGQKVYVRYNQVRNVDGRESNGNGGYQFATSRAGQAFGLNSVNRGIADIAWNEIINLPFQSETEDVISTYNSGGTAASPMTIRFNYVQGGYHSDVAAAVNYSGVVINLGDCEVNNNPNIEACEYVHAFNNRVISFSNKGMDIIGGRNMKAYNNRAVSAQRAPDGTIIGATSRHGLGYWNFYNNPYWANNLMYDNYAKVVNYNGNAGGTFFGPNNISYSATTYYNNADLVAGTQYKPATNPATRADEEAEYAGWKSDVTTNSIVLGPQRCAVVNNIRICQ